MKEYSLDEILIRDLPKNPGDDAVLKVLLTDSQELLLLINGILLADIFQNTENVPPNISGNIYSGLMKPSLGKLMNLALWLSQNSNPNRHSQLKKYLITNERKKQGWLTRLIQLRNAYAHPKTKSKGEVLKEVVIHLKSIPDLRQLGTVRLNSEITWTDEDGEIDLFPFAIVKNSKASVFSEYKFPDTLVFNTPEQNASETFCRKWNKIKASDKQLFNPTLEDLLVKIQKAYGSQVNDSKDSISSKDFKGSSRIGILIETGMADAIKDHLKTKYHRSIIMDIHLEAEKHPLVRMKEDLELLKEPDLSQLNRLADKAHPLFIFLRSEGISTAFFLQTIYMIADLFEAGKNPYLQILLERSIAEIDDEQDRLWEYLPDHLDKMFVKSTKNRSYELRDYIWRSKNKSISLFN